MNVIQSSWQPAKGLFHTTAIYSACKSALRTQRSD
jgi:hypothetical protein